MIKLLVIIHDERMKNHIIQNNMYHIDVERTASVGIRADIGILNRILHLI